MTPRHPTRRRNPVLTTHTHGFAKVNGVWTCIQDFYAAGHQPQTGCGRTWAPTSEKKA